MKINGQLVFDASSASEIQNLRVQKYAGASVPAYTSADAGRLIFATDTGGGYTANTIYYGSAGASNWVAIATGGNAAALQTEVDNIETSLGSIVNSNGVWVTGQVTGAGLTGTETTLTQVLNTIAGYATANDTLAELDDVDVAGVAAGQFLRYNGTSSKWEDHTLVLANVTDVTVPVAQLNLLNGLTATATELNVLDGITGTTVTDLNSIAGYAAEGVSAAEFGYLDGVTSDIQPQLNGKQPLDATLTALAGMGAPNGIVVQTATDTFDKRTLQAPLAGLTISNPAGIAGDPTFALANDLAALEGLATTGFVVRTGDGTATTRSIEGTAGRIVVTDGDGLGSNTDIDLATVTQVTTAGLFKKITLDAYGRVIENTAVLTSDITALVDAEYVNVGGDTMTGSLTMSGATSHVILPNAPTADNHAANKLYVDTVAEGLQAKPAVEVVAFGAEATSALGSATYNNGTLGVGATLTGTGAFPTIDGVTLTSTTFPTNGVLVAFAPGADAVKNGRYNLTSNSPNWVLTRCGLCDEGAEIPGSYTFVKTGTQYKSSGWVQTQGTDVDVDGVIDMGTDEIWVTQFSGAGTYTAGTGLSLSGTQFNVNLGAGITELGSDNVGIDLFTTTAGAIILTEDGTARSVGNDGKLHLLLPAGSGLTQDATGLYIAANAITNAMVLNDSHALNADSGSGTLALGETLLVTGNSTQGIVTSVSGQTFNVTASDASTSQKGVASFATADFAVAAGVVTIKAAGVDNAQLANSHIDITGSDASTDALNLGETLTFVDGGAATQAPLVLTSVATNAVTIKLRQATASALGVASFDTSHFSVTAGAVSLAASIDDLTNVAGADAAATGDLLTKGATDWEPVTRTALAGTIVLDALQDVAATHIDGHVLVSNGTNWVNQKIYHVHTEGTAATTWTVSHALGVKFCNVTVIDSTDNMVIPQSVVFDSTSQLTVTFNTAVAGSCVVMGLA